MLNVYYHGASEETKKRMKPVVNNAVRLMNQLHQNRMLICYAMANHRPDGESRSLVVTRHRSAPSARGPITPANASGARGSEGSWEQKVIEEIAPRPEDYVIPKYRWSTFHRLFDLALRSADIDTRAFSAERWTSVSHRPVYPARDLEYSVIVVRDACSNSPDD